MNFEELIKFAVDQGASDVHLQAGSPPQVRIGGLIRNVEGPEIDGEALRQFAASLSPPEVGKDLNAAMVRGARFSKSLDGLGRFRCSLYSHGGQPGLILHQVPSRIPTIGELNLPPVLQEITQARRGITIVTGPSSSGKSSTLAALVDQIGETFHGKIVTIEDPIEVRYPRKKALVAQRELGSDVASISAGVEQAIAQDADVIVIGEIRDAETVRAVLHAAETGHQVLGTMSNPTSVQAIERLISLVTIEEKRLVTAQLAEAVVAIIAQKLAATKDGKRRAAVEVLRGGQYSARCILESRWTDLSSYLGSRQSGMQQLEQHLLELYQAGVISGTEAMKQATSPEVVAEGLRVMKRSAG
ncbi:type IV pilus twitching motility protein PilT [Aquisphaera insulae]|uniref:type IV pilus twitching motility protein PilT n=1 Tax=Aquisphaera insulae TaxID=2712864 RepID=UPI0013EC4CFC|nr:ATPase, T2SS/T4P/T4SS family [Aquisphaera insulae]